LRFAIAPIFTMGPAIDTSQPTLMVTITTNSYQNRKCARVGFNT